MKEQNTIYVFIGVTMLSFSIFATLSYTKYIDNKKQAIVIQQIKEKQEQEEREKEKIKKQQEADYNLVMSGDLQKITIAENYLTKNNAKEDIKHKISKTVKINSPIAFGYLFINTAVNNNYLSTSDDIYFTIRKGYIKENSKTIGGHLIKENLLNTPILDTTLFLYRIDNINFKTVKGTIKGNFFDVINENVDNKITFQTFINSVSQNREFKEISIYYECETGKNCIEEIIG